MYLKDLGLKYTNTSLPILWKPSLTANALAESGNNITLYTPCDGTTHRKIWKWLESEMLALFVYLLNWITNDFIYS